MERKHYITVAVLLLAALILTGAAFNRVGGSDLFVVETLALDDNATTQNLDVKFIGTYIYQARIEGTADDAVTFSVNGKQLNASTTGATLLTKTTTAATSGEMATPSAYYVITDRPTYTISGVDSGTIYVRITAIRK